MVHGREKQYEEAIRSTMKAVLAEAQKMRVQVLVMPWIGQIRGSILAKSVLDEVEMFANRPTSMQILTSVQKIRLVLETEADYRTMTHEADVKFRKSNL